MKLSPFNPLTYAKSPRQLSESSAYSQVCYSNFLSIDILQLFKIWPSIIPTRGGGHPLTDSTSGMAMVLNDVCIA